MLYCQEGDAANREYNTYLQRDNLAIAKAEFNSWTESQRDCFRHNREVTPGKCGLIHGFVIVMVYIYNYVVFFFH